MASILETILKIESGGRNIPQGIDDINMRQGTPAQGYFQITNPTWTDFGGTKTNFKSAIDAPYDTQLEIAQNIPVARWGPNTQAALKAAGFEPKAGETLGEMLARYKEDPKAYRPTGAGDAPAVQPPTTAPAVAAATPAPTTGLLANAQQNKGFDYAGLLSGGMKQMATADPASQGQGGPPQMPNLPAHRPQMPQGGFQNPFAQQQPIQTHLPQIAGMDGMGLLAPNQNNDLQLRKLLSGLLSGG